MTTQTGAAPEANGIAPEDMEILNGQLEGVQESEKEATDQRVARMLDDERKAGRGLEEWEQDGGEAGDEGEEETGAKTEQQKPKTDESDSQRRRRQRRENATRQREAFMEAQRTIGRLEERLKAVEAKNPDPDRYGDDSATYIADRAGYAAQYVAVSDQIEQARATAKQHEDAVQAAQNQEIQDYFAEGNKRFPDFEKTLRSEDLPFTPAMMEALLDDDMHDVAYELAKQPGEVARIAALPNPVLQVKEILRAQAALKAKAAERVQTKAPPPIKPIRAAGAPTTKSPSDMSMAEYAEWRSKQMARR